MTPDPVLIAAVTLLLACLGWLVFKLIRGLRGAATGGTEGGSSELGDWVDWLCEPGSGSSDGGGDCGGDSGGGDCGGD